MNNEERRLWVLNDEGLYNMQQRSHKSVEEFVKDSRQVIDEVIENVISGKKRSHYLAYPTPPKFTR
jgi:metal-dependent hydrolase (beta-lactamase superfamily II)